jgi:hypothetical protein
MFELPKQLQENFFFFFGGGASSKCYFKLCIFIPKTHDTVLQTAEILMPALNVHFSRHEMLEFGHEQNIRDLISVIF